MYTKKERERYNEDRQRACRRLGITENQYNWFRRKGVDLHKIYENDCNGIIENEREYTTLTQSIYNLVDDYVKSLNLFVYYQTDPRGATIYLDKVTIPENNYTQGVCIY